MTLFIEQHILQALPPSNVNRDGDGAPKSARYGGVRRGRVSSQCWKRATRSAFDEADQGTRSKLLAEQVADELTALGGRWTGDTALDAARAVLAAADIGKKKGKPATGILNYLVLYGHDLPARIAAEIAAGADNAVAAALLQTSDKPLSLALFGRMVADNKTLSVDAACQVAHAISTHQTISELDYYTAVDDVRADADESGAGMLGEIGFQSQVLYRHANLNLGLLTRNLGGDVKRAVDGVGTFLTSFAASMPSGFGNSFAPNTMPKLVAVVVRDGHRPVSLADAFESPVAHTGGGFMDASAARLAEEFASLSGWAGHTFAAAAHRLRDDAAEAVEAVFGRNHTLSDLVAATSGALGG